MAIIVKRAQDTTLDLTDHYVIDKRSFTRFQYWSQDINARYLIDVLYDYGRFYKNNIII